MLQADAPLAVAETVATALANVMFDNNLNRCAVRAAGGVDILVTLINRYSELGIAEQVTPNRSSPYGKLDPLRAVDATKSHYHLHHRPDPTKYWHRGGLSSTVSCSDTF
jgi:hypothetical protein